MIEHKIFMHTCNGSTVNLFCNLNYMNFEMGDDCVIGKTSDRSADLKINTANNKVPQIKIQVRQIKSVNLENKFQTQNE